MTLNAISFESRFTGLLLKSSYFQFSDTLCTSQTRYRKDKKIKLAMYQGNDREEEMFNVTHMVPYLFWNITCSVSMCDIAKANSLIEKKIGSFVSIYIL